MSFILNSTFGLFSIGGGGGGSVTGANNGASLNGANVVLGNDTTGVSGAAKLLSNREIDMDGHELRLFEAAFLPDDLSVVIQGNSIQQVNTQTSRDSSLNPSRLLFNERVNSFLSSLDFSGLTINAAPLLSYFNAQAMHIEDGTNNDAVDYLLHRIAFINGPDVSRNIDLAYSPGRLGFVDNLGNDWLTLDTTLRTVSLGDIPLTYNLTTFILDDIARQCTVSALNGLKITGDTVLVHTGTDLADGAGVNIGTLTNAPIAGNPTKWVTIDDNGTPRQMPLW